MHQHLHRLGQRFGCYENISMSILTFAASKYSRVTFSKPASIHPLERPSRNPLLYRRGFLNNSHCNPRAGCAFVYRPSPYTENGTLTHVGTISFPFEDRGPFGEVYEHTSNRAELRAVIAALQFRDWSTDCNRSWRSVVIATDSEYIAVNATESVKGREDNGLKLNSRTAQKAHVRTRTCGRFCYGKSVDFTERV
jgi:ribonuclease HI